VSAAARLSGLIEGLGSGPVLVHSDAFRAARLVGPVRDRDALLAGHLDLLTAAAGTRGLWMPEFNYGFPRAKSYDVAATPTDLGPIPEAFRTAAAEWRTPVPMFSVAGTGPEPELEWGDETDPFGPRSIFAKLVEADGVILWYGNTFSSSTVIHYVEAKRGPAYRYDKNFPGVVTMPGGESVPGSLKAHVRPLGAGMEYAWDRLERSAIDAGIVRQLKGNPEVLAANARAICDHWDEMMLDDRLSLLDDKTRRWVEPALDDVGRRFIITDFEAGEPLV
jgi:aminoglycoside N3'-acetyltransferase